MKAKTLITFDDVWQPPDAEGRQLKKSGNEIMDKYLSLVRANYTANLGEYAGMMRGTATELKVLTNYFTGQSPQKWREDILLHDAKWYLLHTDMHVHEVAAKMNFAVHQGFTLFFKRKAGLSPKAYRAMYREKIPTYRIVIHEDPSMHATTPRKA
ncbi:MAG: AraC family transcriptional regulator [Tannerellaceae bacterium]|jgi:AraC-like DNA-binding protein|nr:AraC family transcriptional regulator [Tannerellaceae bacterium]